MLLVLLQNKILKAERGDVIVFNNTSAEHPATYAFVERLKVLSEGEYGIPFFWTEFQTYEDAVRGVWARRPTYRLVHSKPFSDNFPNGYRCKGEAFEELLSWKRFVPNRFRRICTELLKLLVTKEFLSDWLAVKSGIDRLGHYHDQSMMRDEDIVSEHKRNRGSTPSEILIEKAKFVCSCPHFRPDQKFSDYSSSIVEIKNMELSGKSLGGRVPLAGDDCVDYVALIGFRADEPLRVAKMKERNNGVAHEERPSSGEDPYIRPAEGEYVYAPLVDMKVTKDDVNEFWKAQGWDLELPRDGNYSNCVFCFLKGTSILRRINNNKDQFDQSLPSTLRPQSGTPSDILWWAEIEEKYGRDLKAEKRKIRNREVFSGKPIIGFFGGSGGGNMSYRTLIKWADSPSSPLPAEGADDAALPCDCTD